jgi:O-antigen ligase
MILLVLAACWLSLIDTTGPLPYLARAIASAAVLSAPTLHLPSWLAASLVVAWGGRPALDLAVACVAFGHLRPNLRQWANLTLFCGGLALAGALLVAAAKLPWSPNFPFANRNHFAVFVELSIPVLIWRWEHLRYRSPWAAPYLAVAFWLSVLAIGSGSRVGTVLILGEWTLILGYLFGRRAWQFSLPALALGLTLLVVVSPSDRILNPLTGDHRLEIYQSTLAMVIARPWSGWGMGEFPQVYPSFALFDNGQFVNAAHSDWLQWAAELGIVPAFALLAFVATQAWRSRHRIASWGILLSALHAAVDFPFHLTGFLIYAAAFLGAIAQHVQETQIHSTLHARARAPATAHSGGD